MEERKSHHDKNWILYLIFGLDLDFITWYLFGLYSNTTLRWSWGTAPWAWRALIGLFEHRCPQTRSSGEHESPTTRSLQPRDFPPGKRREKSTQTVLGFTSSPLSGAQALLVSLGISTRSWRASHGEPLPKFSRSCPSFLPVLPPNPWGSLVEAAREYTANMCNFGPFMSCFVFSCVYFTFRRVVTSLLKVRSKWKSVKFEE